MVTSIISSLWCGRCDIAELKQVTDEKTHITQTIETYTVQQEPCRISHASAQAAQNTDTVTTIAAPVTLFIRPDIDIKEGSRIYVTQHGATELYKASGVPRRYRWHQEIALELWKDKA